MIKFYESIPQSKFSIMITLYRAFAEDSRERLFEMNSRAHSTPYAFIQDLKFELKTLTKMTEGVTKDHFYA